MKAVAFGKCLTCQRRIADIQSGSNELLPLLVDSGQVRTTEIDPPRRFAASTIRSAIIDALRGYLIGRADS